MKTLNQYINEKLQISSKSKVNPKIIVNTEGDLKREILKKLMDKNSDFTDIDISKLSTLEYAFDEQDITEIDVTGWDVSRVKSMKCMFHNCRYLKKIIGLDTWDVSNCEDFSFMFSGCKNLKDVGDLHLWNINQKQRMTSAFSDCERLQTIGDVSNWRPSTPNWDIFYRCAIPHKLLPPQSV